MSTDGPVSLRHLLRLVRLESQAAGTAATTEDMRWARLSLPSATAAAGALFHVARYGDLTGSHSGVAPPCSTCKSPLMFTGLVEEVGKVLWMRASERAVQLEIAAPRSAVAARTGDSVAVNGCCLTVTAHRPEQITFDLLQETLDRTNLRVLRRDSLVNLERPLRADSQIGGHFVQGHIDCATRVIAAELTGKDCRLEVELPHEFAHYVAYKGSIAVNGISLTIAEVLPKSFAVWIIPHTRRATNLQGVAAGDLVNLEFDILAKYVERIVALRSPSEP